MASKMPAARDVTNKPITITDAEHLLYQKPLKCEFCDAKVTFVNGHTRNVGDDIVSVDPFFRLVNNNSHSGNCKYNISGQISVIARESEGDIIVAIEKNKFELRLLAVKKTLEQLRSLADQKNKTDTATHNSTKEKEYISSKSKLGAYINSAKRVLKVRAVCEEDFEIASTLKLVFDGARVPWTDFYFEDDDYFRCYQQVRKATVDIPIALNGSIKDIKTVLVNGKNFAVLDLVQPFRKANTPDTREVVCASVWSHELNAFSDYKKGQQIIAFGMWQAKLEKERLNNKEGSPIKKFVNFEMRLWPVTQSQICRAS